MTYLTECHTKTKRMEVHYRVSIRQGTIVTLLIKRAYFAIMYCNMSKTQLINIVKCFFDFRVDLNYGRTCNNTELQLFEDDRVCER